MKRSASVLAKPQLKRQKNSMTLTIPKRKSLSLKALIRKEVNNLAETKENEITFTAGSAITVAGTLQQLNSSIAEGDDMTQRNGRLINMNYIDTHIEIQYAPAAGTGSGQVFLVYDKAPNFAAPAVSTIFDINANGMAFKNTRDNKERFTVCWTEVWPNQNTAMQGNLGTGIHRFHKFYKIPEKMSLTRYAATAASVPEIGAWYLVYVGNGASFLNTMFSKVTYKDT
jgi:hypothetical protein